MVLKEIKSITSLHKTLHLVNTIFSLKFVNITYKYQYLISERVTADIFK
jgi:hypothetical protein